jgi:nucleolar complex protein 2
MGKSKATKKFESKHLKDSLKQRKEFKAKQQLYGKKKRSSTGNDAAQDVPARTEDKMDSKFADMTVDEFFQGGFEVPEIPKKKRKRGVEKIEKPTTKKLKSSTMEAQTGEESDEGSASSEDDEEEYEEGDTAGGVMAQSDESDFESGDDEETHKNELAQLAQKDPEFHKYLRDHDSELLEFEEGDFDEIDQLSDNEAPKKKKAVKEDRVNAEKSSGNLTIQMINRWEKSMEEMQSLRATREIILAFRAAAHMNDTEGKEFRYSVTNSEGMFCHGCA